MMTDTTGRVIAVTGCGCASDCGCDGGCGCSSAVGLERTRFYPRMIVGPDELTQDQTWVRDKSRRHNRLLHGWGVVCGLNVTQTQDSGGRLVPWSVCVEPGDVLGPCGDEIVVDCTVTFDVRHGGPQDAGPCVPPDPWCSDVYVDRRPRQQLYLAIRYDERLLRPVRAMAACACGCSDADCEYSRIRESFALGILEALPASYLERPVAAPAPIGAGGAAGASGASASLVDLRASIACTPEMQQAVRPCPPCPTDPWVVLADIVVDPAGNLAIDPIVHRRYVAAFGAYSFLCGTAANKPNA